MASGAGHSSSDAAGKAQHRREAERQAGAPRGARGFPRRGRKDKLSFGANTANHASEGLDPKTVKRLQNHRCRTSRPSRKRARDRAGPSPRSMCRRKARVRRRSTPVSTGRPQRRPRPHQRAPDQVARVDGGDRANADNMQP